ncbi:5977_t:CDS:2 [Gigaspora margarita]|uniref:5977_t:CDS:1 n=1 Tax=Gigaspora margarita TaxID=4874 RepID=A0ABN7UGP1_GIGMA|nr:5977_t:CDS:2 [Gigaspora margarita]
MSRWDRENDIESTEFNDFVLSAVLLNPEFSCEFCQFIKEQKNPYRYTIFQRYLTELRMKKRLQQTKHTNDSILIKENLNDSDSNCEESANKLFEDLFGRK